MNNTDVLINTDDINKDDIIVINDSNSNTSDKLLKKERLALLYALLAQFILAIGVMCLRAGVNSYKFTPNNFVMWRGLFLSMITYIIIKLYKIPIIELKNIPQKKWLAVRTFGLYFAFVCFLYAFVYLRTSTVSCITSATPFMVITLSICILKEEFYIRYLLGATLCFIGSALIVMNEGKDKSVIKYSLLDTIKGVIYSCLNVIFFGSCTFTQKIFTKEHINTENQIYYAGLSNLLLGLFVCIFDHSPGFSFFNIFYAFCHAALFYSGMRLTDESLKLIDASKFAPTVYLQTLMVFGLSSFIFGEHIYFSDFVGSLFIISYHTYNAIYPIIQKQ